MTEGDTVFGGGGNALSDMVKCSLKGFAARMAGELRSHRVAAVSITPGFLRSESMLQHFGVTEANWRDGGKKDRNFLESESPLFVGRAVAALAADPKVLERSGDILSSWELARDYGFTDYDGRRPDWGVHFATILPAVGFVEPFRLPSRLSRAHDAAHGSVSRGADAAAAVEAAVEKGRAGLPRGRRSRPSPRAGSSRGRRRRSASANRHRWP